MAFIPVENTAQVNIKYSGLSGQTMENVIYFLRVAAWTANLLANLLATAQQGWDNNVRPNVSNQVTLLGLTARDLTVEAGPFSERVVTQPHAGTLASNSMPANVTWALTYGTGFVGRSFRGRSYFVGLGESQVVGDFLTGTVPSDILADWAAMLAEIENGEDVVHVVVSRFVHGTPRMQGLATPVLSYGFTDIRVDTQRRRLPGEGA